jgi:signal transduction histidine kinase
MSKVIIGEMETIFLPDGTRAMRVHTFVPMLNEDAKIGGLDISNSTDTIERRTKAIWWTMLSAIAATFLLSIGLIAIIGIRYVGRPLEKLVKKTEQIAEGDFSQPLVLGGHDELGRLAQALNQMGDKLTEQQNRIQQETEFKIAAMNQLRHHDRLQTVGQLASGIAHELGTPLNVVLGHADLIASQKISGEEMAESANTIKAEVTRMSKIVRQLMDFSHSKPAVHQPIELNHLCRGAVELLHAVARKSNVNLLFDSKQSEATVLADEEQLKQVLINLIMNAIQAMPEGGNVTVVLSCKSGALPDGSDIEKTLDDFYCVEIRDQGVGMSAEQMERIFEPFYTTKEIGKGTGLGLSIAYGIIKDHDGWMDAAGEPGKGSSFRVFLPKPAPGQTHSAPVSTATGG